MIIMVKGRGLNGLFENISILDGVVRKHWGALYYGAGYHSEANIFQHEADKRIKMRDTVLCPHVGVVMAGGWMYTEHPANLTHAHVRKVCECINALFEESARIRLGYDLYIEEV